MEGKDYIYNQRLQPTRLKKTDPIFPPPISEAGEALSPITCHSACSSRQHIPCCIQPHTATGIYHHVPEYRPHLIFPQIFLQTWGLSSLKEDLLVFMWPMIHGF